MEEPYDGWVPLEWGGSFQKARKISEWDSLQWKMLAELSVVPSSYLEVHSSNQRNFIIIIILIITVFLFQR